jgi:hypothetical protein
VSERPVDARPRAPRSLAAIKGKVDLVLIAQKIASAFNDLSLLRIAQNAANRKSKMMLAKTEVVRSGASVSPGFVGIRKAGRRSAFAVLPEELQKLAFDDTLSGIEPEHPGSNFALDRQWLNHWAIQLGMFVP